ncbi:hypothetical protein CHY_0467 [Carboxydothermus hydrogenoformans Z-2901]|uniref:Uncharacterized protein n=1 Tax=Carboxydothermus hydrogenoformans (strain ATCC BAA-161 / DSM 6008 / Z-2901) TaxID=246194 RepID=Q3AEV9_CARHZ|nr:hypothetical protein CHY_0467 [Carboxydothermus hydrogenoformans Z-2901]
MEANIELLMLAEKGQQTSRVCLKSKERVLKVFKKTNKSFWRKKTSKKRGCSLNPSTGGRKATFFYYFF